MKKFFATLALAAMATAASAQVTGNVKYDYDRAEDTPIYASLHRVTTSLGYGFGKFGTVDAGFVAGQVVIGGTRSNGNGFDVGYSNGINLGSVGLTGRVSYSELRGNRIGTASGTLARTSVAVEGTLPVTTTVTAVAGYEYQNSKVRVLNSEASADRFTVGADVALSKNVTLRAVYARTSIEGSDGNGLTTAVSYKF